MKKNKCGINNKGFMLVEVIVASVMALLVAYFLIEITIKMVNKNNDLYLKTVLEADKSVITKEITDDFNNSNFYVTRIDYIDNTNPNEGIVISFSEGDPKQLKIESNKIIYGNYTKQLNNNITLGDIEITHDAEKEMIYVTIPAYSNYSDENFGINISLKYDPKITNIKIPKIIPVDDIDEFLKGKEVKTNEKYWDTPNEGGYKIELTPGTYKLEVWGAQGGSYNSDYGAGGKGGYSTGILNLTDKTTNTTLYIYVGGQGGTVTSTNSEYLATGVNNNSGGINGGANATYYGGGGGGASDIRIGQDSLYARVIVAGGGGGAQGRQTTSYKANGGYGGGISGGNGEYNNGSTSTIYNGKGATTQNGGAAGTYSSYPASAGTFGIGGVAGRYYSTTYSGSGAGGGGWYGGGGGAYRYAGGGGGSGWVYTAANETYTSSTGGTWLLNSSYHLTNAQTIAGDTCFPSPDGITSDGCQTGYEKGHSGKGYVKIKAQSNDATIINGYYVPVLYGLNDLELEKGTEYDFESDVNIICENNLSGCSFSASPRYASELHTGENKVEYIVKDISGNKYKYIRKVTILEIDKFYYEGNVKMIEYPPGEYKLEVWGAQGGSYNTSYGAGGKGGYSTGILTLTNNTTLYIYVGGKGGTVTSTNSGYLATGVNNKSGGFNGGANATYYGGGGGGASDIRIGQDSLYARVIVAGGGGGAQGRQTTSYKANGGYGGGISGGDGEYNNGSTSTIYNGKGATTQNGGAAGTYSSYPASAGTFGIGGVAGRYYSTTYRGSGAGGGGWYGGGGGAYSYAGGGGGSGWVYTAATETYTSSSYTGGTWLLNSSYHLTNAQTIAGDTCFPSPDGTTSDDCDTGYEKGHSLDGYVKISKLN